MFAVVEFLGPDVSGNELGVVPLSWIHKNEKRCYWPNKIGNTSFTTFVKKQPPPKKNWPVYEILKIHFKSTHFDSADEYLSDLLKDNALDVQESTETVKSLTRKRYDETNDEPLAHNSSRTSTPIAPVLSMEGNTSPSEKSNEHAESICNVSNASTLTVTSDFSQTMMDNIVKLETHVEQQTLMLHEIIRYIRKNDEIALNAPSGLPAFPIGSVEEFEKFDNSLSNETISGYMTARLAAVGGSGIDSLTRRILKFLLSDQVAECYNWKGRDKKSFEKTKVMSVIYEAAKRNFPSNEKNDFVIAGTVKEWLKHAKGRLNSKLKASEK